MERVLAFKVNRVVGDEAYRIFAGTTHEEVCEILRSELDSRAASTPEEVGSILVEAFWTTSDQIKEFRRLERRARDGCV